MERHDLLRILFVEDSAEDAELEERELRRAGLSFVSRRVDTREGLDAALSEFRPDIVISDYSMPALDGMTALRVTLEKCPDVPFVFVSGTLGEERAVASLKAGAIDYVIKQNLHRLSHVVTRALKEARDRAERRHMEEKLREAQKMEAIGRLAGGVAHDFNNLLTAILGFSETLLERTGPEDPSRAELGHIRSAGLRAAELTRQLLAFGRRQTLTLRVLDLNAQILAIEPLVRRLLREDILFELKLAPDAGRVRADASQLDQVIVNFCVNARDAIDGAGRVSIETRRDGADVTLSVRDSGKGMDQATRERLFEPFFTTKALGRGTGLGLATVYGIVHQIGGRISVDTEPGRGSTFHVRFPTVEAPVDPRTDTVALPVQAPSVPCTVLVVEDEGAVRMLARSVLGRRGFTVLEAGGADEAIQCARSHKIDVLVTDIVMPGRGGRELAREILAMSPEVKVLFMSGYDAETVGVDANHGFLAKPFTPAELLNRIADLRKR